MPRTRLQHRPVPPGTALRVVSGDVITSLDSATYHNGSSFNGLYRSLCTDDTGRDKDHTLDIERYDRRGVQPVNGTGIISPTTYRTFTNWYCLGQMRTVLHVDTSLPTLSEVAVLTLSRSNPSRADVSLPNFVYELKDLPAMIKQIGDFKHLKGRRQKLSSSVKRGANYYLSYQMGWKPLINDLRKLLAFQASVDKRIRELEGLFNNGGLQRRVRIPDWTQVASAQHSSSAMESVIDTGLTCKAESVTVAKRWGTVRWYPASRPSIRYSNKDLAKLARSLVFGTRIGTKTIWDAVPWTWLVDWFSNAGDFIEAHDNRIPLTHSVPCIMTHIRTVKTWTRTDTILSYRGGNSSVVYETKQRRMNSGSLSASVPFLSGRQVSILAALSIQRFKLRR